MITVRLAQETIIKFDGEVLEFFVPADSSIRLHVGFIEDIRLDTDRKGKHELICDDVDFSVEDSDVTKINELIAEVQKASTAFKSG